MKKKSPRKKLRDDLWTWFSKFIRWRDGGICITCGKFSTGSAYHAGHFIPACICGDDLKYNEHNVNGQCYNCNINCGGMQAVYEKNLIKKIGKAAVVLLWKIFRQSKNQWTDEHLRERLDYYKELCRKNLIH